MNTTPTEMLTALVDLMRRCDPEYCASHSVQPCTDDEWDDTLAEAEEVLEELEAQCEAGHPHKWEPIHDWVGDQNVINGVQHFTFWRCKKCGVEETAQPRDWAPVEREYERD